MFDPTQSCWRYPKIRGSWKMVLAAVVLLIVGTGMYLPLIDITIS
jgi:hypothetical protein